MMIDIAIVLDMDGLMVDTEPLARRAWDQVLSVYGYTLDDAVYNRMIGHRLDESVQILVESYNLPLDVDDLARQKNNMFSKVRDLGVPIMPGLYELHAAIIQRDLLWGVATSSPRSYAEEILLQLELKESCQVIAGGDEVPYGKPAPDIYLLAAERLGVLPSRCLALEDSAPGCRSALSAGMLVAAVPNGDTETADFPAVEYIFSSLYEVTDKLDTLLAELTEE